MDLPRRYRRSLRLRGFDYAQEGVYFVTICTQDRCCVLSEIRDEVLHLTDAGRMVQDLWERLPDHYPGVETDAVVVMPNHVHGVLILLGNDDREEVRPESQVEAKSGLKLGDVVHRFKSLTTHHFADGVKQLGWPAFPGRLWQRNYFEHVVRDAGSLARVRDYIAANPTRWAVDSENPNRSAGAVAADFPDP